MDSLERNKKKKKKIDQYSSRIRICRITYADLQYLGYVSRHRIMFFWNFSNLLIGFYFNFCVIGFFDALPPPGWYGCPALYLTLAFSSPLKCSIFTNVAHFGKIFHCETLNSRRYHRPESDLKGCRWLQWVHDSQVSPWLPSESMTPKWVSMTSWGVQI